jgi:Eukaryotic aspartyl protease
MAFLGLLPCFISCVLLNAGFSYSLGPIDLTNDTVSGVDLVPTVADNLYRQGTIPSEVFGAFLQPSTVSNQGELSFGSPDYSKTTSDIGYAPLTSTFPSNQNWGIDMSVTYGKHSTNILNRTAGIVDTGRFLYILH